KDLTGKQKAAVFILAIGPEVASNIYKYLNENEMEMLTVEIANLESIPSGLISEVIAEFFSLIKAQEFITSGGISSAKTILERAVGAAKAAEIMDRVQMSMQLKGFRILQQVDANQLTTFLQKEHPQTIALILSQLTPGQAASVIADLPPTIQVDVINRLAQMERVSPETIKAIEDSLESRIELSQNVQKLGGIKLVADILNLTGQRLEKHILGGIARDNPELATEIKNLMFVFEDLINLDDRSIQKVLKEIDNRELALALKATSEDLKNKILSNMSKRAADIVLEELKYMGPVRLSEVENTQQRIIDAIRKLEEDGQIALTSAEEQMV
ncbi:MAG: flagellar motor switch protein FliG, partial [bacterium]